MLYRNLFMLFCLATPALAQDAAPTSRARVKPTVLHKAVALTPAGERLRIVADVVGDWRLERLDVLVRSSGQTEFAVFPLKRVEADGFLVDIPADFIRGPRVFYAIESVDDKGQRIAHFASREDPHPVVVRGRSPEEKMAVQLARFGGHRSQLSVSAMGTVYGSRPQDVAGETLRSDRYSDRVLELEAEYLYRPLGFLHDFRFAAGVLRAKWPTVSGDPIRPDADPGLTYGAGAVTLEPHRWFTLTGRLLLGVSAEGFVAGGGAVARIGDISANHMSIAVDGLQDVGVRTDLRFHWTTVPGFPMALGMELTDWPADGESGDAANLSYDLGWEATDALTLKARMGLANRSGSFNGGYTGGLSVLYGF